jgi:hypothetical protein
MRLSNDRRYWLRSAHLLLAETARSPHCNGSVRSLRYSCRSRQALRMRARDPQETLAGSKSCSATSSTYRTLVCYCLRQAGGAATKTPCARILLVCGVFRGGTPHVRRETVEVHPAARQRGDIGSFGLCGTCAAARNAGDRRSREWVGVRVHSASNAYSASSRGSRIHGRATPSRWNTDGRRASWTACPCWQPNSSAEKWM